jgi:hypothetical protein
VNKSSIGNVESAAKKKADAAATEWWNVSPQAPAAEGLAPAETAPAPAGQ